jgi:hypothetical protein
MISFYSFPMVISLFTGMCWNICSKFSNNSITPSKFSCMSSYAVIVHALHSVVYCLLKNVLCST